LLFSFYQFSQKAKQPFDKLRGTVVVDAYPDESRTTWRSRMERTMTKVATTTASPRRVLTASMVGTAVEFYDFYIFGTAASLVFGPLFFPGSSPEAQLLQSWLTFSVAFIARPIGALVFGHFGDRIGRKSTLVASLVIMGLSTFLIAFLPGYASIGWVAPALLCLLRFGQGFGLGGEWGGASLLAVENAPPGKRARYGMMPQLGAPLGFIASNGLFLLLGHYLSEADFISWGWRIPFLASALLVIIGLWIRLRLTETPAFAKALEEAPPPRLPVAETMRHYPREVIGGTLAAMICFALFYLATVYALGYGTSTRGFPREQFLTMQLQAILALAVSILISGWLADRFTPRLVLMAGCVMTMLASFLTAPWLGAGSAVQVTLYMAAILFAMGFVYGPLGAWLPGLFPARVRYTGASIGFNMGGILGGAFLPTIAAKLSAAGGLTYVGHYIAGIAFISLAALAFLPEREESGAAVTPQTVI
jgi:MFS family permease